MSEETTLVEGGEPTPSRTMYQQVGVMDRAIALMDATSSMGFEAIVELEGPVDGGALEEAWKRLAWRHPILSCVREGDAWQPSARPPMGTDVSPPGHHEPPVALRVGSNETVTRLTLLCNHVAFDGMASVILVHDLRDEYVGALEGRNRQDRDWGPRTLEAVAAEDVDWRTATTAVLRRASAWWQTPASTHVDPAPLTTTPATDHALMELGPVLEALGPLRRRYHWSTDAVIVGVLDSAWTSVFGAAAGASSWLIARDLRPALGLSRGIGNLSVTAGTSIPSPGADLSTVIDRVDAGMKAQARDLITVAAAAARLRLAAEPVFTQMLRRSAGRRHYRSVSNVGQLGRSLANWGAASLRRVWFVGPLADSPYTSFIAAGQGSSTLVSVRTSPLWLTVEHAAALERAALELV